jgi:hypothetical protein
VELGNEYSHKGESLLYGETLCLRHRATGRYLAVSKVSSEESSDKFISQLIPERSSAAKLQIHPRYKTRSEGEQVFFDDKVTIMHKSGGG